MKKHLFFFAVFMVILSLVSCSFEPIATTYGDIVHDAVKKHYSKVNCFQLDKGDTL